MVSTSGNGLLIGFWASYYFFCTHSLVKQIISFIMEENGPFCVEIKDSTSCEDAFRDGL